MTKDAYGRDSEKYKAYMRRYNEARRKRRQEEMKRLGSESRPYGVYHLSAWHQDKDGTVQRLLNQWFGVREADGPCLRDKS